MPVHRHARGHELEVDDAHGVIGRQRRRGEGERESQGCQGERDAVKAHAGNVGHTRGPIDLVWLRVPPPWPRPTSSTPPSRRPLSSPAAVREPLEAFLDAHGIGSGRSRRSASGKGTRTSPSRCVATMPALSCAALRAPLPPSAHDVLREARLLRALEPTPVRVPGARGVRRRVGARSPLLRDGGDARQRDHLGHPARDRRPRRAAAALRGARGPSLWRSTPWIGRPAGSRATASPRATWSASCAASRGCGSTTRARAAHGRRGARLARCQPARLPSRRSCTATTASAT